MRTMPAIFAAVTGFSLLQAPAEEPPVTGVEAQPLLIQVQRLREALEFLGEPLPAAEDAALAALQAGQGEAAAAKVQEILDRHCLAFVNISPESRVKVATGPAPRSLDEGGWRH